MYKLMLIGLFAAFVRLGIADDAPTPAEQLAQIERLRPALVRVEYWLQYDKNDEPRAAGWAQRCPSCGQFHNRGDLGRVLKDERPLETVGYLVSPTRVVAPDVMIHPRFVREIRVCAGDQSAAARIGAYATQQNAVFLDLAAPLPGTQPLEFAADAAAPYSAVTYSRLNGDWTVSVQPLAGAALASDAGRKFRSAPTGALIIDKAGRPAALALADELPVDDSWRGAPASWPLLTATEYERLQMRVREAADQGVLKVTLNFRSPKASEARMRYRRGDEEGEATERHTLGVLMGAQQLVILEKLPPAVTTRLERITVDLPDGSEVPAKFTHTLRDYGAFVAELERPVAAKLPLSTQPLAALRNRLLPSADIYLYGAARTPYFDHCRIAGFEYGRKRQLWPTVTGLSSNLFVFDPDGALAALPVAERRDVTQQERWDREESVLTPIERIREALADLPKYADASNVPLTEEQENRIAWLGLELQPLDAELARANNVSEQTQAGQTGALVSYVYADSPAAQAGIQPGCVLLRIQVEGQPKPLAVDLEESRFGTEGFPWDQLDEVPEEYYDRIPQPWPSVENSLTRSLTDLGFGRKFAAEFFQGGQLVRKDFVVVESPAHYNSAARFKSEPLGLTVRNLTYEVRRYFQLKPDDPGVIVSKLESGSRASVGGLKPYELITHVNDKPVTNVAEFEKAIAGEKELRLSVKRMTRGRLVKIDMSAPLKAAPPKTPPAAGDNE